MRYFLLRRLLPAACALLLALSACSAREGSFAAGEPEGAACPESEDAAPPEPEEEGTEGGDLMPPSSGAGEPQAGAADGSRAEEPADLQPGRIFALGDPQEPLFPEAEPQLATGEELSRWQALLSSGKIARLDAGGMHETGAELSAESAGEMLAILKEAGLGLYESIGNPPTGGAERVFAYAADGSRLFSASYNGEWLSVQFGEESGWYIFNGEGSGLERLQAYIPA